MAVVCWCCWRCSLLLITVVVCWCLLLLPLRVVCCNCLRVRLLLAVVMLLHGVALVAVFN